MPLDGHRQLPMPTIDMDGNYKMSVVEPLIAWDPLSHASISNTLLAINSYVHDVLANMWIVVCWPV